MSNEVIVRHLQRTTRNGVANVVTVEHGEVGGRSPGSLEIEFEHIGTEQLPTPVLLDGYVFGLLFFAMRGADRMIVEGRLSREAIRNAWSIDEAWNVWAPEQYRSVEIVAEELADEDHLPNSDTVRVARGNASIAAFSGGANSMFTILRHTEKLPGKASHNLHDVCMVHGFDVRLNKEDVFRNLQKRISNFIEYVGCRLHVVRTNIREATQLNWEHCHGSQIAAVLHQFSHSHAYGLLASGDSSFRFPPTKWGSSPVTDHYFSGANFQLVLDGSRESRFEKIQLLANYPPAHDTAKVCYENQRADENCGVCVKCTRTRINFLAAGINHLKSFGGPITIEEIQQVKINTPHQLLNYLSVLKYVRDYNINNPRFEALERRVDKLSEPFSQQQTEQRIFISPTLEFHKRLSEYKKAILRFVAACPPGWTLTDMLGNIGDHLIWQGTERLLEELPFDVRSVSALELISEEGKRRHGTLVVPGSGAFNRHFHEWAPQIVVRASTQFDRVIVLPSEYEPEVPLVKRELSAPNVFPLARDKNSYSLVKQFSQSALGIDPALYAFEVVPTEDLALSDNHLGKTLLSLRYDQSSLLSKKGLAPAKFNVDISLATKDLSEFLSMINEVDTVITDRLHVVVAATMLGKHTRYIDPYNLKISRYIEFNFRNDFDLRVQKRDENWLVEHGFAVLK